MPRGQFDALRLDLADGERVHVYGRPELFAAKGEFRLRALSIERFGARRPPRRARAAEDEARRGGPVRRGAQAAAAASPAPIGLVTGNDAAAKRDVLTAVTTRFPPAHVVVAETLRAGPARGAARSSRRSQASARSRRRRRRARPRRRELRGPAPVQRRAARARGRGLPRAGRLAPSATSRTRRSATSPPTCAPRRRPRPAGSSCRTSPSCTRGSTARATALAALGPTARSSATASGSTARAPGCDAHRRSPSSASGGRRTRCTSACGARRSCSSSASAPRLEQRGRPAARALPERDARARLRDRPRRGRRSSARAEARARHDASTSSSPRAASAPASRRRGERARPSRRPSRSSSRSSSGSSTGRRRSTRRSRSGSAARSSTSSAASGSTRPGPDRGARQAGRQSRRRTLYRIRARGCPRRPNSSSESRSSPGSTRASWRRSPAPFTSGPSRRATRREENQGGIGFFIIRDGEAKVTVRRQRGAPAPPGDYFGEIALITRARGRRR